MECTLLDRQTCVYYLVIPGKPPWYVSCYWKLVPLLRWLLDSMSKLPQDIRLVTVLCLLQCDGGLVFFHSSHRVSQVHLTIIPSSFETLFLSIATTCRPMPLLTFYRHTSTSFTLQFYEEFVCQLNKCSNTVQYNTIYFLNTNYFLISGNWHLYMWVSCFHQGLLNPGIPLKMQDS